MGEGKWALGRQAEWVKKERENKINVILTSVNMKEALKPILPVKNSTLHNPLKLYKILQQKSGKNAREQRACFWTSFDNLEFLLKLNYTPAWIILLFIKAFHSNTLFTQITKQVTTTSICKLVWNFLICLHFCTEDNTYIYIYKE